MQFHSNAKIQAIMVNDAKNLVIVITGVSSAKTTVFARMEAFVILSMVLASAHQASSANIV